MNRPGHILIYKSRLRSYRDLPVRRAELGTVYRYERSGVLHGLLRVRGFTQDDAHIFCVPEQIERDRKSTRLNSSHSYISYAVFCLKKKKKNSQTTYALLNSTCDIR